MIEGVATKEEIDRHYCIVDLLDAHIALDLKAEVERRAAEAARRRSK